MPEADISRDYPWMKRRSIYGEGANIIWKMQILIMSVQVHMPW